jgi:DNA-binding NarL/FixJ family response regulator
MVANAQKIRILMVARNDVLRNGLQALLAAVFPEGEIEEAESEASALESVGRKTFHLVIFYPGLPMSELMSAARKVKQTVPALRTILITEEPGQRVPALEAGIDQTILCGFTIDELTGVLKKLFPGLKHGISY